MFTERVYGAAYSPDIRGRRWRCVYGARVWRSLLAWDSWAKVVGLGKWSAHSACDFSFPNTAQGTMRTTSLACRLHGFFLHRWQPRETTTHNQ